MSIDKLEELESRVKNVVKLVQQLKQENEGLRSELHLVRERIREQEDIHQEWEIERSDMSGRIEKVLGELDGIEAIAGTGGA